MTSNALWQNRIPPTTRGNRYTADADKDAEMKAMGYLVYEAGKDLPAGSTTRAEQVNVHHFYTNPKQGGVNKSSAHTRNYYKPGAAPAPAPSAPAAAPAAAPAPPPAQVTPATSGSAAAQATAATQERTRATYETSVQNSALKQNPWISRMKSDLSGADEHNRVADQNNANLATPGILASAREGQNSALRYADWANAISFNTTQQMADADRKNMAALSPKLSPGGANPGAALQSFYGDISDRMKQTLA